MEHSKYETRPGGRGFFRSTWNQKKTNQVESKELDLELASKLTPKNGEIALQTGVLQFG